MTSDQTDKGTDASSPDSVPPTDAQRMFASMMELGAGMMRLQQRMFAMFFGGTATNTKNADDLGTGDQDIDELDVDEIGLQAEGERQAHHDAIAARAQQIAASPQARGELDDWLQAERELSIDGITGTQ